MNVFLLGDYSGLHWNLKKGLESIGHTCITAGDGDGIKKISKDISLPYYPRYPKNPVLSRVVYRTELIELIKSIRGYDVVQLVGAHILPFNLFPYQWAIERLKRTNRRVCMLASGSDSLYWTKARQELDYGPFDDFLEYDMKSGKSRYEEQAAIKQNLYMAQTVHKIIPTAYDYSLGYSLYAHSASIVPLPLWLEDVKYKPNQAYDRILVHHGYIRYGFKGTRHIKAAFQNLQKEYRKDCRFEISTEMSLDDYIKQTEDVNILVDQTNTYSYGMNALYSAARGKITLSGAEPIAIERTIGKQDCPIMNIKPDIEHISQQIRNSICSSKELEKRGRESREFVQEFHCSKKVAKRFLKEWE